MRLTRDIATQLDGIYRRMAREARYRPAAPSDGCGHVTVPARDLDLDAECRDYAADWWEQENTLAFHLGCCCYSTREATVYAVEAARAMCGADNELALRLLEMATASLRTHLDAPPLHDAQPGEFIAVKSRERI